MQPVEAQSRDQRRVGRHEQPRKKMQMLHKKAPHPIVGIAQPVRADPIREQEQPCIFQPAGRQHHAARTHDDFGPIRPRHPNAFDHLAGFVRQQLQRMRVQAHRHVRIGQQRRPVVPIKPSGIAELKQRRAQHRTSFREQRTLRSRRPRFGRVGTVLQPEESLGPAIVRRQRLVTERPSAEGDRFAMLEVDRIERPQPDAAHTGCHFVVPQMAGASQRPRPGHIQGKVGIPRDVAPAEPGGFRLRSFTARFQHADAQPAVAQRPGQRQSGHPAPYDAQIVGTQLRSIEGFQVDFHEASPGCNRSTSTRTGRITG